MNDILETMHYPLEKLSVKTLDYHLKTDPTFQNRDYHIQDVSIIGRGEIIRDSFLEFSKIVPKEAYLVVDFERKCDKKDHGYDFNVSGKAIILK
ncbi:MAG TPA: hypothetical protein V6C58_12875 [Allocoleopsis sp.]